MLANVVVITVFTQLRSLCRVLLLFNIAFAFLFNLCPDCVLRDGLPALHALALQATSSACSFLPASTVFTTLWIKVEDQAGLAQGKPLAPTGRATQMLVADFTVPSTSMASVGTR